MGPARYDQSWIKAEKDIYAPRVKYMCSHGGRILPRPQDDQLRYVGGETRVVAIKRNISYSELMAKLAKFFGPNLWLKYQLPNQDLDSLISVTCDEDVENMMEEYDRNEAREGALRLRAFLFPATRSFGRVAAPDTSGDEPKSPEQKYVDAVNGAKSPPLKPQTDSSPTAIQLPDGGLFRFDPAKQRHEEGEMFSPTYKEHRASPPINAVSQVNHARQPSSWMDAAMRCPAQATSAVDSLMPSSAFAQTIQEMNRARVGDQRCEQSDEKHSGDGRYSKLQRHAGVEFASTGGVSSRGMRLSFSLEGPGMGRQQSKQRRQRACTVHEGAHENYKAEMKQGQQQKKQQFAAQLLHNHHRLYPGEGHNEQEAYWQAQWHPKQHKEEHGRVHNSARLRTVASHLHRVPSAPPTICRRQPAAGTTVTSLLDNLPHPHPLSSSAPPGRPLPPFRYDAPALPPHEARVLRPTTNQQPLGAPLPPSYRNRAGPCAICELTRGPKSFLTKGIMKNQHPAMQQVYYIVRS